MMSLADGEVRIQILAQSQSFLSNLSEGILLKT